MLMLSLASGTPAVAGQYDEIKASGFTINIEERISMGVLARRRGGRVIILCLSKQEVSSRGPH